MRIKRTKRRRVTPIPMRPPTPFHPSTSSIAEATLPAAVSNRVELKVEEIVADIPQLTIIPEAGWEKPPNATQSNIKIVDNASQAKLIPKAERDENNTDSKSSSKAIIPKTETITSTAREPKMSTKARNIPIVLASATSSTEPVQPDQHPVGHFQPAAHSRISDEDLIRWLYTLRIQRPRYRRHQTVLYYPDRPAVKVTFLDDNFARLQCRGLMVFIRLLSNERLNINQSIAP